MRTRKFLLIAALAVAAVVAARTLGVWVGGQIFSSPTPPTPSPALVFATDDLNFGPIPESEPIERDLRLTNTTAEPITVEWFETSCSCLGVEPVGHVTLAAGETKTLRIKLKASIPVNAKLSADGLFDETVTVTAVVPAAVSPTRRLPAEFRYTVRQTVSFDPPVVSLGVVSHREPLTAKATLTLRTPITDVRVLPHPEWVVTVTAKGDTRELALTPTRPGVTRMVSDTLQVVPVGTDGIDRPARPLAIRGEVKSDVVSSSEDIRLGRVPLGDTREETFRLRSLTKRAFEVREARGDLADVTVSTDPSDSNLFVVRVTVRGDGEQQRKVLVAIRQDDGSELAVLIPIHYHGTEGMK